jgi:hypothetical protein
MALFACLPAAAQSGLYVNYWESLFVAVWFGMGVSTFFFKRGGVEKYARCVTKDQLQAVADDGTRPRALRSGSGAATLASAHTPSAPVRFFLGHEWNPAFCGIDVKMWLYLAGAVGLACNILACAAAQRAAWGGEWSRAMLVYCACFAWFLVEYLIGEEVHLYTYDLFAEKLGFKLAWGCLVFYPYFYGIGAFPLVHVTRERDLSTAAAAATAALFLVGWVATRGANLQKFFYRTQPQRTHFLCIAQRTVPGSRILVSGYARGAVLECPSFFASFFFFHFSPCLACLSSPDSGACRATLTISAKSCRRSRSRCPRC